MITTVQPARRQRRETHGAAAVTTAASMASPTVDATRSAGTRVYEPSTSATCGSKWSTIGRSSRVSSTAAPAAAAAVASRNQRRCTTATTAPPTMTTSGEDLTEQDHAGDEPGRQRLEAPDQVGDEPDDGLVEERADDHDHHQHRQRDGEPQDVGRRLGRPTRLGRDDLRQVQTSGHRCRWRSIERANPVPTRRHGSRRQRRNRSSRLPTRRPVPSPAVTSSGLCAPT